MRTMAKFTKEQDVRRTLCAHLAVNGKRQKDWAIEHGISPQYVSDFLSERRKPGPAILKALGFELTPYYRRRAHDE